MQDYVWESKVRDYELDSQGIVNNAVYFSYFEECRNQYARSLGVDLRQYFEAGYNLVLASIKVEYKRSLLTQDEFYVTAKVKEMVKKHILFAQEIRRKKDNKLIATALAEVACVDHQTGRACMPTSLLEVCWA